MERKVNLPVFLRFSTRLYQALLTLYPSEFRRVYGDPMLQVFRDSSRRALRHGGTAGLLALWARTMLDTVQTAIEEHAQRGVDMSKEKFYKLSGWALILGPILFLIGGLAISRPAYNEFNFYSLPIDRYANAAGAPLMVIGLFFMSLGLLGLLLRFTPRLDAAGLLLGLSALSGFVAAVGAILMMVVGDRDNPWWNVFILGICVLFFALIFFGLLNIRRRLFPRWNWLPILSLWVLVVLPFALGVTKMEIGPQVFGIFWLLAVFMFAGLGYMLQSDSGRVKATLATP